ncbi:MAG: succinylglutamate desuccinylase/aspartoacylase family protein [Caulobacteraceae bacterium]
MVKYDYSEIKVAYLANGLELTLPVHKLTGGKGPTVGISAVVHGDELIGAEIVRRLLDILKKEDIKGTIKFMPVANSLAFEDVQRNTPIDRANLNRIYPGNKNGTLTEILAYKMTKEFLEGLDVYIDLHSGGRDPIVDYVYILNDEEMSRAFGSTVLYRPAVNYVGTTSAITSDMGIPSVTIEVGGGPNYESYIEKGVKGILNILKQKKVIKGRVAPRPKQIVVSHIENVNPHHGGLCVPCFEYDKMNKIIEGKQVLARIYNPMTLELLEEIKTPYDKNLVILMRGTLTRIHAGDYAFMIGEMSTAEVE